MKATAQMVVCPVCGGKFTESECHMRMDCELAAAKPRPTIDNFPRSLMCFACERMKQDKWGDRLPSYCRKCNHRIIEGVCIQCGFDENKYWEELDKRTKNAADQIIRNEALRKLGQERANRRR